MPKIFAAFSSILTFTSLSSPILAHAELGYSTLEEEVATISTNIVIGAVILLALLTFISVVIKKPKPIVKTLLFSSILLVTVLSTLFLSAATIFLNVYSYSKGPVHYHADFQVWNCQTELTLVDPTGLSNKIGTPTLHEHNDKRIHLEGVVVKPVDASLGKFFKVTGGEISPTSLSMNTTDGLVTLKSGDTCPDGQPAELQVFVYKVTDKHYTQTKISNPESYVFSPYSAVPPGDCIIVEFGPNKPRTDRICQSYEVALKIGKLQGELRQ